MTTLFLSRPLCWVSISALCLSLSGCFGLDSKKESDPEKLPEWIMSPPRDNTHLYGVGSAPRIDNLALAFSQAEREGNVQIAQQLRTQVSQVNTQDTRVTSSSGQSENVSKIQTAYTQVKTAPISLEQTQNIERFAAKDYVYALQSIDRARIVARLRREISDLDDQIHQKASQLTTSSSQPANSQDWQVYMNLIPYFAQRKEYQSDLNLYSGKQGLEGRADEDIRQIEQQLSNALSEFGFDATGTAQSHALASALSSFGFTPKSHSVFRLSTQTSQHQEIQGGRFYVFEEGSLTLIGPKGATLASWSVSARGIAKEQESAKNKATEAWAHQAVEAMFLWLTRL